MDRVYTPSQAMLQRWTTIRYLDRRFRGADTGRVELTVWSDRRARVAYLPRPDVPYLVFDGELSEWVLPQLITDLQDSGFPSLARATDSLDDFTALLSVATETGVLQARISRSHRRVPSVDRSVLLLEGIARSLSKDRLLAYQPMKASVLRN